MPLKENRSQNSDATSTARPRGWPNRSRGGAGASAAGVSVVMGPPGFQTRYGRPSAPGKRVRLWGGRMQRRVLAAMAAISWLAAAPALAQPAQTPTQERPTAAAQSSRRDAPDEPL